MRVALGFSIHTGWAVAVAVRGARPEVLVRRRLALAEDAHDARFVYHAAAEKPALAKRMIGAARRVAVERARAALGELVASLEGHSIVVALPPAKRALPPLERILQAHPLLHRAEGELYRGAVAEAAEHLGLPLRILEGGEVPDVGKMSPPWGKDQKAAAALAWAALRRPGPR
jgi:hypothetical protein